MSKKASRFRSKNLIQSYTNLFNVSKVEKQIGPIGRNALNKAILKT